MNENYQEYFEYLKNRSWFGLLYRRFWLYPRICNQLNGRVLDVGCGIGDFIKFRKETIGVDINPEAVKFCRAQGLDVIQMDEDKLPFLSEEFNGVLLDNVLEHIESPKSLLDEVYRVLKPAGNFLVGVPGKRGYLKDSDHKVFYDYKKIIEIITPHGFIIKNNFYMPFGSAVLDNRLSQFCLYVNFIRD